MVLCAHVWYVLHISHSDWQNSGDEMNSVRIGSSFELNEVEEVKKGVLAKMQKW